MRRRWPAHQTEKLPGVGLISRHSTQPYLLVDRRQTHTCPNLVQRHQLGRRRGRPCQVRGTREPGRHPFYMETRHLLLFEDVLNLLADVFEVGLHLVALALIFSALVAGNLADRFLPSSWSLFFALSTPLTVSVYSYFAGNRPRVAETSARG